MILATANEAALTISQMSWVWFVGAVLVFLALDLGVFHRKAHAVGFREALIWTTIWFSMAMAFALCLAPMMIGDQWGDDHTNLFITGYVVELSLSMDNVFVIALIFAYFRVPLEYQHRVLFWGILGALVMRGAMIFGGAGLIHQFDWILYVFGAFLLFSGIKMLFVGDEEVEPEKNVLIRLARRIYPVTTQFVGQRFFTKLDGRRALTPLALCLIMVETTDLIFAVDSIPAIFGITTEPFIVFTSNVFAILGLRSLYFLLVGLLRHFCYLKYGLALVLVFIGFKMLIVLWGGRPEWLNFEDNHNGVLIIVAALLGLSIVASLFAPKKEPAKTGGT
ncbi:MAG TPA: TerC family protein [Verrucomicrobiota bacterium]|jgi:tellurite resistance protein TerC|nr:TerC family protein [Verrucomicrobiota bacterium]